jgi:hypothetical protein
MEMEWGLAGHIFRMDGVSKALQKEENAFLAMRRALDVWERKVQGSREPDELLEEYVGRIREEARPGLPGRELIREAKRILSQLQNPDLVKFVMRNHNLRDREAFWLCLGIVLGGKTAIDLFHGLLQGTDEDISTT